MYLTWERLEEEIFGKKLARKSLLVIGYETNVMKFFGKSAGYADGPLVFSLDL